MTAVTESFETIAGYFERLGERNRLLPWVLAYVLFLPLPQIGTASQPAARTLLPKTSHATTTPVANTSKRRFAAIAACRDRIAAVSRRPSRRLAYST